MPNPDFQKYIFDVVSRFEEIEIKSAVEQGISIIGEALYKTNKIKKDLAISNLKNIIGMRYIVIHDHDLIETERLFITIQKFQF